MSDSVIVPPDIQAQFPDIIALILASESMNVAERQYWVDVLPSMSPDQVAQLRTILTNERDQLALIDAKYKTEIEKSGTADLEQTSEVRQRKREELSHMEGAEQTEADRRAEDILSQME